MPAINSLVKKFRGDIGSQELNISGATIHVNEKYKR
jgi:hypothetical protein